MIWQSYKSTRLQLRGSEAGTKCTSGLPEFHMIANPEDVP
jgi:hypothetical protein